jgi:hypothetical protein
MNDYKGGCKIMKYKTTAKALRNGANNLVSAGYCDLQYLLSNHNPVAYTCGVYGWNFDVYEVYGVTICTGYRGMPGRTANNIREYEQKARELVGRPLWGAEHDAAREKVEALLKEFCEQA